MWNFNKILGISGYAVVKHCEDSKHHHFSLKSRRKTGICPVCLTRTPIVHDYRPRRFVKHGMMFGKTVLLVFAPRRFSCLRCQSIFTEEFHLVRKRQRTTLDYKKEVVYNLSDRSFQSGKRHYHVSYHTQRRWLSEIVKGALFNFDKEEKQRKQFVLGIDEASFSGYKMVTTIANITARKLKGVLPNKNKAALKKLLRSFSPTVKSLIKEVVIDMTELYLNAVKETLPKTVNVVVDKFHVIQDANKRIDEERQILQNIYKKVIPRYPLVKNEEDLNEDEKTELETIFTKYSELKIYHATKERLRIFYKKKDKEEARWDLRTIISYLTSSDDGELISWGRTLDFWKEHILNYYDSRSTNAYVEGIHNKMKLIKRISFGFKNKEVFIQKVMLSVLITTLFLPHFMT